LSSITDRHRRFGQILPIFAFGMIGILAIAALVFDVGRDLLERRRQQNTADSAALAGARYLVTTADTISGLNCKAESTLAACQQAVQAARDLATRNGYSDGVNGVSVRVNIPPDAESKFAGVPGHIQVVIDTNLPSFFSGVLGINTHRVATIAVAGNIANYSIPYGLLALNPHACGAGQVGGNGTVNIDADVMVASDCSANPGSGSLQFDGTNATITAPACLTSGEHKINGNPPNINCATFVDGYSPQVTDPLAGLAGPKIGTASVPNPPAAMIVDGAHAPTNKPPAGCPGSTTPATQASPSGCAVSFNRVKTVRIFPGVYWGGLKLKETSDDLTVYMEPGIYYMAGGGFEVAGELVLRSVTAGGTTYGGGVMIYNDDIDSRRNECAVKTPPAGVCIGPIDFQNTAPTGDVDLHSITTTSYAGLLMFQDRAATSQPPVKITGHGNMTLQGTIYLPKADFDYGGNGAGEVLNAQVIADEFKVNGNGSLTVTYDPGDIVKLRGIGLVQ